MPRNLNARGGNFHLNSGRLDRSVSVPRSLEELERLQPVHAQQVAVQLKCNLMSVMVTFIRLKGGESHSGFNFYAQHWQNMRDGGGLVFDF